MADLEKEVLIDIKLDRGQNEKEVDKLTQSITDLTKANNKLIDQNKSLIKAGQENSKEYKENIKQLEINKQKINENTASRKGLIQAITAEDNSIKQLKIRNAELIKQRDLFSTKTEKGRQRISEINAELERNNKVILENSSAMEKQRANIGNYPELLKQIAPGFAGMAEGIGQTTKASLAFIATPLGATLGAVSLLLAPLASFLTSTGDGMDYVEQKTTGWGNALGVVKDEINELGAAMFESKGGFGELVKQVALANPLTASFVGLIEGAKAAFPELTKRMEEAAEAGEQYAIAMDDINTEQRIFNVEAEETENAISRLMLQSRNRTTSEEERIALIDEALEKERELTDQRVEFAEREVQAVIGLANSRAKLTQGLEESDSEFAKRLIESLDHTEGELADRLADALVNLEKARGSSIAIEEKLQNQRDALVEKDLENKQKQLEAQEALNKKVQEWIDKITEGLLTQNLSAEEFEKKWAEMRALEEEAGAERSAMGQALVDQSLQTVDINARLQDDVKKKNKQVADDQKKNIAEGLRLQEAANQQRLTSAANVTMQLSGLFARESAAQKAFAITSIALNTGIGIANAVKAGSGLVWPANLAAIASGIAAVLAGISQAKQVLGFAKGGLIPGYAEGGISGQKVNGNHGRPITRSNGDNRLVTVKTGEVILNKRQQMALGGDATFHAIGVPGFANGGAIGDTQTRVAATEAQGRMDINQFAQIINQVQTVLVMEDFEAKEAEKAGITRKTVIA